MLPEELRKDTNAIESAFGMIQKRIDGRIAESGQWHRLLLDSMATHSAKRSAVISADCHDALLDYLAFRHHRPAKKR